MSVCPIATVVGVHLYLGGRELCLNREPIAGSRLVSRLAHRPNNSILFFFYNYSAEEFCLLRLIFLLSIISSSSSSSCSSGTPWPPRCTSPWALSRPMTSLRRRLGRTPPRCMRRSGARSTRTRTAPPRCGRSSAAPCSVRRFPSPSTGCSTTAASPGSRPPRRRPGPPTRKAPIFPFNQLA